MKTLAELQAECIRLGVHVETKGRASKEPYVAALRDYHWRKDHPGQPLPCQIMPMLLGSWEDLSEDQADEIEQDCHAWLVQPKMDGVRALLHFENGTVRITSRTISEVTYRLSEFQANLPQLTEGESALDGTILDGELVCPMCCIDTGTTVTATTLQATVAVLATSPENACRIQSEQKAEVRFHVFDVLCFRMQDVTPLRMIDRQTILEAAMRQWANPFAHVVPSFVVNKPDVHHRIIEVGGEGTVWKKADAPYEPGRRVQHWIKRKAGVEAEAFVTGFKPGNNGHSGLVGAVEFSVEESDGTKRPIGWVSSWTESERKAMTTAEARGNVQLERNYLGRRAIIAGQSESGRSRRIRHAKLRQWLDAPHPG